MFTRSLIRASAACAALVTFNPANAAEFELPVEDRGSAWFAPSFVANNRPMCAAALEAEHAIFFAPDDDAPEIPGLIELSTENGVIEDPDVVVLEKYPLELTLTLPDRSRAFVYFYGYGGCGSACETGAVAIDDDRMVEQQFQRYRQSFELPHGLPLTHRYGPDRWRLFKASDGDFYLRGTLEDHTQWYRVAAADRFELACDIALKPDTRSGMDATYSKAAADAIESLRVAADHMAGDPGDCGSMHTPGRWAVYRARSLEAALYRPWAVVERHAYESANSGGDYARIVDELKLWSLGGVMEYRDFAAYQTQFARTAATVTEFYRAKFGWAPARATQMAEAALKGAISSGFGFYAYEPYTGAEEQLLREAILARAPLEEIRNIAVDPKEIDRAGQDSILNVAIDYPEALRYLLERGFDPNISNILESPAALAASWFNKGLICEQPWDPNVSTLDGAICEQDRIEPFVKSWKTQASSARANKLRALIRDNATSCAATEAGRHYRLAPKQYYRSFLIYALHRANEKIDVSQIRWPAFAPNGVVTAMPGAQVAGVEVVDSLRLGDDAVTLLEVPVRDTNSDPHKIGLWIDGRECKAEL